MTSEFADAAEEMARVLGIPKYDFARIEHPLSSADEEGLERRAQSTLNDIRRILLTKEA